MKSIMLITGAPSVVHNHRARARVRKDFICGTCNGVNGTPTCVTHGTRYDGPANAHGLFAALTEAIV